MDEMLFHERGFKTRVRKNGDSIELRYTLASGEDVWYDRFVPVQVVEAAHPEGFARDGCPKPRHTAIELRAEVDKMRGWAAAERDTGEPSRVALAAIFDQAAAHAEKHLHAHLAAGIL